MKALLLCLLFCLSFPLMANADLWVSVVQPDENNMDPPPDGTMDVFFQIRNIGNQTAFNFTIAGYTNRNRSCSAGLRLQDTAFIDRLDPGETLSGTYTIQALPGDTELFAVVKADITNAVLENNENNNCMISTGSITIRLADLRITAVTGPDPVRITPGGPSATFTPRVNNDSSSSDGWPAAPSDMHFYLSTALMDPPASDRLTHIKRFTDALDPGDVALLTTEIDVPADFPLGTYNLFAEADANGVVPERDESNNFSPRVTLEVVDICSLSDVNQDGAVNISDLILIVNAMNTLTVEATRHLDLARSPEPFPAMIGTDDLHAALPCFGSFQFRAPSGSSLDNVVLTPDGSGGYDIQVDLQGEVSSIRTLVRLPLGASFATTSASDPLVSGVTAVLPTEPRELVFVNAFASISLAWRSLNGTVSTAHLAVAESIDLTRLEPLDDDEPFTSGIAVWVDFADGSHQVLRQRFGYSDIPDPAFRTAIEAKLSLAPGDWITSDDAASIVTLNLENLGIADLTGIADFRNLRSLYVGFNQLQVLDLAGLNRLITLEASHNQLSRLSSLPAGLINLGLNYNPLVELPDLSAMSALEVLGLHDNAFSALPDLSATSLVMLDVSYNHLTSLPNLPASLQYLDANDNFIAGDPSLNIVPPNVFLHRNLIEGASNLAAMIWPAGATLDLQENNLDSGDCAALATLYQKVDDLNYGLQRYSQPTCFLPQK